MCQALLESLPECWPSHQPEDETGTGQGSNSSKVSKLLRGNAGILASAAQPSSPCPQLFCCACMKDGQQKLGEGGDLHAHLRLFRHILQEQGPPLDMKEENSGLSDDTGLASARAQDRRSPLSISSPPTRFWPRPSCKLHAFGNEVRIQLPTSAGVPRRLAPFATPLPRCQGSQLLEWNGPHTAERAFPEARWLLGPPGGQTSP